MPSVPPPVLFHATSPQTWHIVRESGLHPMGRQYVHLSVGTEMALAVGSRKDPHPVVLHVDAASATDAGVSIYQGNTQVWLTDHLPARFLTLMAGAGPSACDPSH